jgi:hypothetical protein
MGRLVLSARRRWAAIGAAAVLGLLAGAGYAALSPPVLTSNALVVLPASTHNTATQVVIARSNPVLAAALQYSGVADLTDRHPRLAIDHGLAVHRPASDGPSAPSRHSVKTAPARPLVGPGRSACQVARS